MIGSDWKGNKQSLAAAEERGRRVGEAWESRRQGMSIDASFNKFPNDFTFRLHFLSSSMIERDRKGNKQSLNYCSKKGAQSRRRMESRRQRRCKQMQVSKKFHLILPTG